ncbi:MAG TPA: serpin family protein, partial [Kofleriaceae bacterium]|nr:serpin family protein [Kofleriaceae bacterium]
MITARQLPAAIAGDAAAVVAANNQFACDVYAKAGPGNTVFSPFSISTALAMLEAGAAGTTDDELRTALHFTLPPSQLAPAYGALLDSLDTGRDYGAYTLATADRLFGQQGFAFQQPYLDTTDHDYHAPLQPLDFESDPDGSRTTINQWVSDQTDAKIPELFPAGSIDSSTRLVLANAILFKGEWDQQFDPAKTTNGSFHIAGGADVTAPLMHAQLPIALGHLGSDAEVGVLPFRGKDLALVVIVPDDADGLPAVEAELTGAALDQAISSAQPFGEPIEVTLPKFTISQNQGLNELLASLGIHAAFDPTAADFSGIDGAHDLFVQAVFHDAMITVDEHGAEAAAATGVSVG